MVLRVHNFTNASIVLKVEVVMKSCRGAAGGDSPLPPSAPPKCFEMFPPGGGGGGWPNYGYPAFEYPNI